MLNTTGVKINFWVSPEEVLPKFRWFILVFKAGLVGKGFV